MTKQDIKKITIPCERCKVNPAKHLKGGEISGFHNLYLLCDKCLQDLKDERQKERRR